MNDRIKQLLKELSDAINESISNSEEVSERMQRLRDEGYEIYIALDATIGLNKTSADEVQRLPRAVHERKDVPFRINVDDLNLLKNLGIDPTRKVKTIRRIEAATPGREDE